MQVFVSGSKLMRYGSMYLRVLKTNSKCYATSQHLSVEPQICRNLVRFECAILIMHILIFGSVLSDFFSCFS